MSSNPYQVPSTRPDPGGGLTEYGRIDVGEALKLGWSTMLSHFWLWLGVGLVASLVVTLSAVALFIPLLIVGPAIGWGYVRFLLDAVDERAEFNAIWSGFNDLGTTLAAYWAFILFTIAVGIPGSLIQNVGVQAEMPALSLFGLLVGSVINVLSLRWSFAPYFIVDQSMGGLEAVKASWNATKGQWFTVIVLGFAAGLIIIGGLVALIVGVIPAMAVMFFSQAAAYRQLVGQDATGGRSSDFE